MINEHIKRFGELTDINERLSENSKEDLINLKTELEFINKYDVKISDIIEVIDKLIKMNWDEISYWREHIITNYVIEEIDKFTLKLIDSYCSNIEEK